jgi:transcriptional regulator with XRE-family HTH domain
MDVMNEPIMRPFKRLGDHLKSLREKKNETLAEVSGAVEIDTEELETIERGTERPSEDILMLLISHFGMQDNEAVRLWELAGYDKSQRTKSEDNLITNAKQMVMLLAFDTRTIYSDGFSINVDPSGVVLNFTQAGERKERLTVSRVGMSIEQAENMSQLLQRALLQLKYGKGPRGLPPSSSADSEAS